MLIREIITNRPLTPEQQQQANIKRQQKALKVKKVNRTGFVGGLLV